MKLIEDLKDLTDYDLRKERFIANKFFSITMLWITSLWIGIFVLSFFVLLFPIRNPLAGIDVDSVIQFVKKDANIIDLAEYEEFDMNKIPNIPLNPLSASLLLTIPVVLISFFQVLSSVSLFLTPKGSCGLKTVSIINTFFLLIIFSALAVAYFFGFRLHGFLLDILHENLDEPVLETLTERQRKTLDYAADIENLQIYRDAFLNGVTFVGCRPVPPYSWRHVAARGVQVDCEPSKWGYVHENLYGSPEIPLPLRLEIMDKKYTEITVDTLKEFRAKLPILKPTDRIVTALMGFGGPEVIDTFDDVMFIATDYINLVTLIAYPWDQPFTMKTFEKCMESKFRISTDSEEAQFELLFCVAHSLLETVVYGISYFDNSLGFGTALAAATLALLLFVSYFFICTKKSWRGHNVYDPYAHQLVEILYPEKQHLIEPLPLKYKMLI